MERKSSPYLLLSACTSAQLTRNRLCKACPSVLYVPQRSSLRCLRARLQEYLQVCICALSCRLRRFFCFLSPQLFVVYVALDMPPFTDCRRASLKPRPRRTLQLFKPDRSLPLLGPTFWRATARTMCLVSSTEIRFLRERALVACQRFDAVKCFEDFLPATSAICWDALQLHQCCCCIARFVMHGCKTRQLL